MRTILCAALLVFVSGAAAHSQRNTPELDSVIQGATDYVARYEAELGNLIGAEEYLQTSVWFDTNRPPRVAKRTQRRTSSDFLIIQIGPEWAALRKVNRVDGLKVAQVQPSFEDVFDNSPQANARRIEDMKHESTEHNIGDIRREMNLPTFALKVLRKSEVTRFYFERSGSKKIDGIPTWVVRFREQSGRSLVVGANGETLYSKGTFWIEPETGRVLQTEIELENRYIKVPLKGTILVTYGTAKKVEILVPTFMSEHYESEFNTVDCRADYSNFRPFEVDVKFEIKPPEP